MNRTLITRVLCQKWSDHDSAVRGSAYTKHNIPANDIMANVNECSERVYMLSRKLTTSEKDV